VSRVSDFVRSQCRLKLAHNNILTAMKHAHRLSIMNKEPFSVYQCEHCTFIHVGRLGPQESYFMYGGFSENVRELQARDWK
jgi:hypothetical protein